MFGSTLGLSEEPQKHGKLFFYISDTSSQPRVYRFSHGVPNFSSISAIFLIKKIINMRKDLSSLIHYVRYTK